MKLFPASGLALMIGGCGGNGDGTPTNGNASAGILVQTSPDATDRARRISAAIHTAFPSGTLVAFHEKDSKQKFDEHNLIDAPSGPVLLSVGHVPDATHMDSGMVAIHYLATDGSGFRVLPGGPRTYELGTFGHIDRWGIRNDLLSVPVIYAVGSGTWGGYTCGHVSLIALLQNGPRDVAKFQAHYDDSGTVTGNDGEGDGGKAESIDRAIGDVLKNKGFTVHYSGTRSFEERYRWQGGKFELEGGKTQVPEC